MPAAEVRITNECAHRLDRMAASSPKAAKAVGGLLAVLMNIEKYGLTADILHDYNITPVPGAKENIHVLRDIGLEVFLSVDGDKIIILKALLQKPPGPQDMA